MSYQKISVVPAPSTPGNAPLKAAGDTSKVDEGQVRRGCFSNILPSVLPLPIGSPTCVRNAEPRCSVAVSARSDLTAKQKLKKGSMTVRDAAFLQWKLEEGHSKRKAGNGNSAF